MSPLPGPLSTHSLGHILAVGDSLTQHGWDVTKRGWTAQLSQAYLRRLDVINRGYSGFNSRWIRSILPRIVPANNAQAARLITILLGANDAQYAGYQCHVPLPEYKENLEGLVEAFQSPESELYALNARILLITPPPLGDRLFAQRCLRDDKPNDRRHETSTPYAEVARAVAAKTGVPLVDLWAAIEAGVRNRGHMEFDGYEEYLWDGLHLNANGNDLLFGLVMDAVRTHYPELDPNHMSFTVPEYRSFKDNDELLRALEQ
ncbi:isoamyl acetate-hydrolyzing esterase [Coemansia sp. RSA 552]|nr:isoamyl acetate-hydrolyzing esterase [Coemansia sp. RSA 552]